MIVLFVSCVLSKINTPCNRSAEPPAVQPREIAGNRRMDDSKVEFPGSSPEHRRMPDWFDQSEDGTQ